MSAAWAVAVVRIERLDEQDVEGPHPGSLLVRVHLGIGDGAPQLLGPQVADRAEAHQLIRSVLEGIYDALAGSALSEGSSEG